MGKFVISQRYNNEYQFNLVADNGQVILSSEGYSSKSACSNGIESVKINALDVTRFDKKISSNGKYYFNLRASNGQIIGSSEMYESQASRDNGLQSVMTNVQNASTEDKS
jgi:uncharacterized protein